MAAGTIALNMVMRTEQFRRDIQNAKNSVTNFSRGLDNTLHSAKRLATGLLAMAGVTGIGYMIKQQMQAIDVNLHLAERLGITTESLIAMQYAAKLNDIELGTMNNSIEIFNRKLGEASLGAGATRDSIQALGLNYKDLVSIPIDDAFGKVADKVNALGTQSQKAAIIQALFGKSSKQLMNLMAEGSTGITKYRKETEQLGISISNIDSAQVELANISLTRMRESFRGVFVQMMPQISPYIEAFSNSLTDMMTKGDGVANTFSGSLYPAVKGITLSFAYLNDGLHVMNIGFKTLGYGGLSALSAITKALAFVEDGLESFNNTIAKTWAGKQLGMEVMGSSNQNLAFIKALENSISQLKKEIDDTITQPLSQDKLETWYKSIDKMLAESRARAIAITSKSAGEGKVAGGEGAIELESVKMTSQQKLQTVIKMYEDMGNYGQDWLETQTVLLQEEKANFKAAGISDVDFYAWKNNEIVKLEEKRAEQIQKILQAEKEARQKDILDSSDFAGGFGVGVEKMQDELQTLAELGANLSTGLRDGLVGAMSDAVFEAKNFEDALREVGQSLAQIAFKWAATQLVTGGMSSLFGTASARGNVFDSGRIVPFERGGIISRPTLFPMANGAGLMGESGPEAIMPLKRTSGGRLGVETSDRRNGGNVSNKFIMVYDMHQAMDEYMKTPRGVKATIVNVANNKKMLG